MAITEEPYYLVDTQPQRLELLAVLLPRLGGVVGHEHQPLALRRRKYQQRQAIMRKLRSCELISWSIAVRDGPSI